MNEIEVLLKAIKNLTSLDENTLTNDVAQVILDNLKQQFSSELIMQSINETIRNFEAQGLTKVEAQESVNALLDTLREMIYEGQEFTGNKKVIIDSIMEHLVNIFNSAVEKYHSYSIELPITVDTAAGAKVPTYAHDTDAAADLYAIEDITIPANSYGNKLRTGVKIQLPEGWLAMILPRSSIGAKTPLRLSNSIGLIDSGYRGELGILYDNISYAPYTVHAGDRIAQLLVMPSYRFQAKVVDILADSDRGEGGFGSSGA